MCTQQHTQRCDVRLERCGCSAAPSLVTCSRFNHFQIYLGRRWCATFLHNTKTIEWNCMFLLYGYGYMVYNDISRPTAALIHTYSSHHTIWTFTLVIPFYQSAWHTQYTFYFLSELLAFAPENQRVPGHSWQCPEPDRHKHHAPNHEFLFDLGVWPQPFRNAFAVSSFSLVYTLRNSRDNRDTREMYFFLYSLHPSSVKHFSFLVGYVYTSGVLGVYVVVWMCIFVCAGEWNEWMSATRRLSEQ